jgi:hypothetical protein
MFDEEPLGPPQFSLSVDCESEDDSDRLPTFTRDFNARARSLVSPTPRRPRSGAKSAPVYSSAQDDLLMTGSLPIVTASVPNTQDNPQRHPQGAAVSPCLFYSAENVNRVGSTPAGLDRQKNPFNKREIERPVAEYPAAKRQRRLGGPRSDAGVRPPSPFALGGNMSLFSSQGDSVDTRMGAGADSTVQEPSVAPPRFFPSSH